MEKPIKYAAIPATFDETKHYIEQLEPVDLGEYMFVDVVIKDLDLTETEPAIQESIESTPYIPEPTTEDRLEAVESAITALMGV